MTLTSNTLFSLSQPVPKATWGVLYSQLPEGGKCRNCSKMDGCSTTTHSGKALKESSKGKPSQWAELQGVSKVVQISLRKKKKGYGQKVCFYSSLQAVTSFFSLPQIVKGIQNMEIFVSCGNTQQMVTSRQNAFSNQGMKQFSQPPSPLSNVLIHKASMMARWRLLFFFHSPV